MPAIAELEAHKLKALSKVFTSIIKSQQLRIENKKLEIKQISNNVKNEMIELGDLEEALNSYREQVDLFKHTVKIYEKESDKLNKQIKTELKNVDYFG